MLSATKVLSAACDLNRAMRSEETTRSSAPVSKIPPCGSEDWARGPPPKPSGRSLVYSPRMSPFSPRTIIRLLAGTVAFAVMVAGSGAVTFAAEGPLVAAAASLRNVLPEIVDVYVTTGRATPRITFGSSGNLLRQIRQGAPYEIFLSADESYPLDLAGAGLARDEGIVYGVGRLVILVPKGSELRPDGSLSDLESALQDGRLRRLAVANPEHAPYGKAAREALERNDLWESVKGHLVVGENVSQAVQFALSGSADGGIVAYALSLIPPVAERSHSDFIPEEWHAPLRQRMVLLRNGSEAAEHFYQFLQGKEARAIFARHGFLPRGGGSQ